MKKKILFFVGLLFFCMNFVSAKGGFYFGWDNGDSLVVDNSNNDLQIMKDNNIGFKHGYVTTRIEVDEVNEETKSYIYYYDRSGNELKKEIFKSTIFGSLKVDGDYIYTVALINDNTDNEIKIVVMKLDSNLKKVKEKDITNLVIEKDEEGNVINTEATMLLILPKIIGIDGIGVTEDGVAILFSLDKLVVLNKDLSKAEKNNFDEKSLKKYFPNLSVLVKHITDLSKETETLEDMEVPKGIFLSSEINGDTIVSSGIKLSLSNKLNHKEHGFVLPRNYTEDEVNKIDYLEMDAKLVLFDSKYNQKWEIVNKDYLGFINTVVINNYIVTIGLDIDFTDEYYIEFAKPKVINNSPAIEDIHSDILVYDMNGNLVQTIANSSLYWGLEETETGFIVSNLKHLMDFINSNINSEIPDGTGVSTVLEEESKISINSFNLNEYLNDATQRVEKDFLITMTNEVWFVENNIKTNVVGKGNVTVVESSLAGNDVTFKVEPQDGYVLSVVKVVDQEGNILTFTDYTFTMPSADVTIEAIFIKNPDTLDKVIVFFLIFVVSCLIIKVYKRKFDYLR